MEFLKSQFARMQEQFAHLTASQKMLAGALAIITVMTLYYWTTFAGKAEMEVLINQPMAADKMAHAVGALKAAGINCKTVGDKLHVGADQKLEALAILGSARLLPQDTRDAFDELIAKSNPFTPRSLEDKMFVVAKQTMLAQAIKRMPDVEHALVLIDTTRERGFNSVQPSASLSVTLRAGAVPNQQMAETMGNFVAGAVASLQPARVKVQINDRSYRLRDQDDQSPMANSGEWLDQLRAAEKHHATKIRDHFGFIEGVFVTVNCKLNNERTEKVEQKIDSKNVVQKAVRENNSAEENASASKSAVEPGVAANVPQALETSGGGEKTSTTNETNSTEFVVKIPMTDVKTLNAGGDATVTGVSVLIPRSYLVRTYKVTSNSGEREPDPTVLQTFVDAQLQKMRGEVKKALGGIADEALGMSDYMDSMPSSVSMPAVAATAPVTMILTNHAKEIALGALALVSLFMVSNMVRKGGSAPTPAVAMAHGVIPRPGPMALPGREEAVGEAVEGDPLMEGMELDEESAKAQQMLNQVSELVEENPDAAANLVKRWMNRS
jgi:flagellar biosynthesis/type III secretory pathway M-ring protein FliF/YscJ